MLKQDFEVDERQLSDMKHCIGFSKDRLRDSKYLAWRNYFTTSDHVDSWDNLILQGLAEKRDFKLGVGKNPQVYFLTDKGFKYLEQELKIRIVKFK